MFIKIFKMDLYNFLIYIKNLDLLNLEELIEKYENASLKGYLFESLSNILIKIGVFDNLNNNEYIHYSGNINNNNIKQITNMKNYLINTKYNTGNSTGVSDITLKHKITGHYKFITCKYKIIKDIKDLDIQNIISVVEQTDEIKNNYSIDCIVKDKANLLEKIKNCNKSSNYLINKIDKIYDLNDLNVYYNKLKNLNIPIHDLLINNKLILSLRFHQELIIIKTIDMIKQGHTNFLWGCKCRSGKTYMTGGLIDKMNVNNILIITPAPSETIPQFTDDLFNKFINFNNYTIHNQKTFNNDKFSQKNIFIISKQYLQKYLGNNKINKTNFDIIIFDENHFSGTTNISKNIINDYSTENTIKIFLTATYNKPLLEWNIPNECRIYWDIEDEQMCKNKDINALEEKHIKLYVKNALNLNSDLSIYNKMPDLHLITNLFEPTRFNNLINKFQSDNKFGFCFQTLFSLNNGNFIYPNEITEIVEYISGSTKVENNDTKTIFSRINKLTSKYNSRQPFTQIWFLPSDNIDITSKNLKVFMEKDSVLKDYVILCINRTNKDLAKNVKDDIIKAESYAKNNNKKGVILLAGNMLNLGITINLCDVVILLNNSMSSDKVFQQMFRCMTEDNDKTIGIVVDMNINRVLNTCLHYLNNKTFSTIEEQVNYLIDYNLINIDKDLYINKEIDNTKVINKLLTVWKTNPLNHFKYLLNKLQSHYINIDSNTQKLINKMFKHLGENFNVKIKLNQDENQELPSGIDKQKENQNNSKIEKEVSFVKEVLPTIIPLLCLLSINEFKNDILELINYICNNKELLDIFNEQCYIWWDKQNLIYIIKKIVENFFEKDITKNINNIIMQIKNSMKSLIDQPKELLELINDCLKPKEKEKKKYGEVFTPMNIVNEMLDTLPKEVWDDKDLKWFDPACGMGNFPIAVYLRLMESLKPTIKCEKQRKKWILEEMLYMSELNKKNVLMCKQIFDINNEYKLNIYCGDSLELDTLKEFGVKEFDIVMGNPPYNKNGTNTGNSLWDKFVKIILNCILKKNGYLLFVHPATWRKPESSRSKLKGLFKLMTQQNHLIKLNINDSNSGLKTFNCGTRYDIYLLQKINSIMKKTNIIDEKNNTIQLNLNNYKFLPNCDFDIFNKIIDFEKKNTLNILNDFTYSRLNKKITSKTKNDIFKFPLVYLTPKSGIRYMYSNVNNLGHFGVSKVIIGETGLDSAINDYLGEYGMTQDSFAILTNNKDEGERILKAIKTDKFKHFIKYSCSWSNFRIDWRLFSYLKKDFYKEFLHDEK